MRVEATHPSGDDEQGSGEQGAVAVVVAVCLIVLLGLSAFAVDFGLAYSETRQVQTAADAAAVAAASAYAEVPGNCTTMLATLGTSAGEDAGEAVFEQNLTVDVTSVTVDMTSDIRCEAGVLRARWTARVTTDTTLARAMPGAPDQLTSERTAEAVLGIPGVFGEGLRPFALCSVDLPDPLENKPTEVRRTIGAVNGSSSADPRCPEPKGNWWLIQCPAGGPGINDLQDGIRYGCPGAVRPVQGASQPATGAELVANATCPPDADAETPDDCLTAKPGDIGNWVEDDWDAVMASQVEFQLPVFCAEPRCSPPAYSSNAGGRPVTYPIMAVVTVEICGYHHGRSRNQRTTGVCADNPAGHNAFIQGDNQDHYLLLVYKSTNYSNTVVPSSCRLGDACDFGTRSVFMVD